MVKIDGKEVRGWIPKSEEEDRSFKNLLSARMGLGSGWMMNTKEGLEALQVRLEAAGEVMGTTTATRNKNKFKILDDIRKMATEAAKFRIPIWEKHEKLDGNLVSVRMQCPTGKIVQRLVVKKLWIAGRAGEDRRVDGGCEGPLRKMLRRRRWDFGRAGRKD